MGAAIDLADARTQAQAANDKHFQNQLAPI
jgi:hypothetical protein